MSRVIILRAGDRDTGHVSREEYRQLLDRGLTNAATNDDLRSAVEDLIGPGSVGMKTNCLVGRFNSTPVALIGALGDLLEDCGRRDNDLLTWDRTSRELERAGFELNAASTGRRCLGTDAHPRRYGGEFFNYGLVNSLVSAIVTDEIDHHINVPILKDHSIAGLSGGLKNMYGAIHNPNKYHDNNCNPYAAQVSALTPIRTRHRLTVMDAVQVQYDKGPGYMSEYIEQYGALIISADPVAADAVGLRILENLRRAHDLPALREAGRPADYLGEADTIGLGIGNLDRIEVITERLTESGQFEPWDVQL